MDAKMSDIEILPPRLQHLYTNFTRHPDKDIIYFGLRHIKNVGIKECEKLEELTGDTDVSKYNWMDSLINIIYKLNLNKRSAISLIAVGAFNGENNTTNRQQMLYEFDSWKQLSAREQKAIADNHNSQNPELYGDSLAACIDLMIATIKVNSRRLTTVVDIKNSLKNPFYNLDDKAITIATDEEKYMSCSLTCDKIDGIELNVATSMCKDVANGTITGKVNLAAQIVSVRTHKTKRGRNPGQLMAFLCAEDGSGSVDSITVFPECYEEHRDLLVEGNTVLMIGETSKRDRTSLIVNKVSQI
jgi:DNA polymerase III alpha subunit